MPTTLPNFVRLETHQSLVDPDADYRRELKRFKKDELIVIPEEKGAGASAATSAEGTSLKKRDQKSMSKAKADNILALKIRRALSSSFLNRIK